LASQSFPTQVATNSNAALSSGDNTLVSASAAQAIKVYQLVLAAGTNADTPTLKFTLAGTAFQVAFKLAANSSITVPFTGVPWGKLRSEYRVCD
jgi:hypothetical protein